MQKKRCVFLFIIYFLFLFTSLFSQVKFDRSNYQSSKYDSSVYSDIPLLLNGLNPNVCLNSHFELICTAINWATPYTATTQKINEFGKKLWADSLYGLYLAQPQYPEYAFLQTPDILPSPNGGAYFAYGYSTWIVDTHHPLLFKTWPFVQKVNSNGEVEWGRIGLQLSNRIIPTYGGAAISNIEYASDGDILVYWGWFTSDISGEYGIYIQKINANTGEFRWGEEGKLLLKTSSVYCLISPQQTYLIHSDSVLCLNKNGEKIWDLNLLQGIENDIRQNIATNDSGDVLLLYNYEGDDVLFGLLFNKYGNLIWKDLQVLEKANIFRHNAMTDWGYEKWLFGAGGCLHCIDKKGEKLWGDEGLTLTGSISQVTTIDDSSFYCSTIRGPHFPFDSTQLLLYKVDKDRNLLWGDSGIVISEKITTNNYVFTDSLKGVIVAYEANSVYEPYFRPRGTYVQRVSKNGKLGFITGISNYNYKDSKLSSPSVYGLAYPNPFQSKTNILVQGVNSSIHSKLKIKIYNLLGREVVDHDLELNSTNQSIFQWSGTDKRGKEVVRGIYYFGLFLNGNLVFSGKIIKGG